MRMLFFSMLTAISCSFGFKDANPNRAALYMPGSCAVRIQGCNSILKETVSLVINKTPEISSKLYKIG
jgi:hypothetical protein